MAHPEAMQGLTFQQPPSCYSYPWKYNHPRFENYLPVSTYNLHTNIHPCLYFQNTSFQKSPESPAFFQHLLFFQKKSGESHDHHLPTRNTHQLWTRSGRHLPSLSIGLLPLGSFGSGQFFLHLFLGEKMVSPPLKKRVWQVNIETIQEKGEVFILCDYVAKCFERTSNGFRCNQASG